MNGFYLWICYLYLSLAKEHIWILNDFSEHPSSKTNKLFYNAFKSTADTGACCLITPYLNFVNQETKNKNLKELSAETKLNIPRGSLNGEFGGLRFVLDAESFSFSDQEKHSSGFRIAISHPNDKHLIRHDSYFVSTGKYHSGVRVLTEFQSKWF